ncbi:amino acid/amide ABC transporter ATP-binding protein 2, HAAT family [Azospirillum oryzae]|uniref:Amino acid/amide ABC transporter ATP-binding protein 2, HAAT family n=1 Tax=Azospirillum oryzae TaxID=286727 RepID=A0A1X7HKF4_9PROT|nr:urea ABC transporter ATP-binding subunit UrtE [Azospirillum oryzae]SMF88354.1 amino acid/amide ABC transporter ATP-binding protein 2, HAAT family [Azospirillum oryzae]
MLDMTGVTSFYGSSPVLQNVSLSVPRGAVLSVLGRNGVGKTTLMRTIMGLTDRATGGIGLDGRDIQAEPTHRRAELGIAYVPQGRGIIGRFTIRENILMGSFARPDGKRAIPPLVFELFPYLGENLNRRGGDLSGGQQQQLAIARALAANPSVLLLDEPTEGIQPNIVEQIQNIIVALNREHGLTIVLVEQNVRFVRRASQRFLMLDKGRVAAHGDTALLSDELVHRHMTV